MADEQTILEYVIRAQDQARGILQQQLTLLQQMSTQVTALASAQQVQVQQAQASARAATQQGDSLDRLIKLYDNLEKATARTSRGFQAMAVSLQQGGKVSLTQASWLNSLNTAVQSNSGFMAAHGKQWNSFIGQMQVGTQITPQLIGQFNQLGQQFNAVATGAGNTTNSLQGVGAAATAVSAAVGALATVFLQQLISQLQLSVKEASLFQNTFLGLGSIAKNFGQDIGATNQAAKDLAEDGLMSIRDTALTLKNLLAAGFNLEEAVNLAKGFKDIASFNRQASLDLGYAVTSASEGIKNQNSLLVDNAGLTKNLTIILKEMGLSEQDLAKVQTDVNVRTKLYNGLLKEMGMAAGDAQRYTETFSGSQSKLAVNLQLLRVAIGDQLLPLFTTFNNALSATVEFLRNNDSAVGSSVRVIATLVTAFLAFSAILVTITAGIAAFTGAVLLLTPALAALGLTVGGVAAGIGGIAAVLTVVAAGFLFQKKNTDAAVESLNRHLEAVEKQRSALGNALVTLNNVKDSTANQTEVQAALNKAYEDLKGIIPGLGKPFKDLDDAITRVGAKLKDFDAIANKINLNRIKTELSEFGPDAEKALNDTLLKIAEFKEAIATADPNTAFGRGTIEAASAMLEQVRARRDAIEALLRQQEELTNQTKAMTAADQAAFKAKQDQEAANRNYMTLVKGQITTQEQYTAGANKLQENINLLVSKGMSRDAAMRLPEIVKQAKELVTSSREGVAPMNALADAVVKRGEAIERARRLEQEAAEHSREFQNRTRALTRAFYDQTVGVDSLAKKNALLSNVMRAVGVDFDSSIDQLRPFQALLQEIVDQVEEMGTTAPANFDKIKAALLRLPGGESPIDKLKADNLRKGTEQVKAELEKQNKIALRFAEAELEANIKSSEAVIALRQKTTEEIERNEIDSLAKRMRALDQSYAEQLRDVQFNAEAVTEQEQALIEWYVAAAASVREAWRKEYYGPTVDDLEKVAADSKKRHADMAASGNYTASAVRAAWLKAYEDMKAADKSRTTQFLAQSQEILGMLASQFQALSQAAGDSGLGKIAQQLGVLTGALHQAGDGAKNLDRGMEAWGTDKAAAIQDIAAGVLQIGAAFLQATQSASRAQNAFSGALMGAQVGGKLGGVWGAVAGGLIGAIAGAFRKPEWAKVQDQVKRDLGVAVSEGLSKAIADTEKTLRVSRSSAIALNLSAIIGESGENVSQFRIAINELFKITQEGGKNSARAIEELGSVFGIMVTEMDTTMNGMADGAMLKFIERVKESGQEVKAVTEFLDQMANIAGESLNKVVAAIVGSSVTNFTKLEELVDKTLPDLLEKEDDLLEKISKERDPRAIRRLQAELKKVQDELKKTFADADRLSGGLTQFATAGQEGFDRTGRLIATTFAAGIASGKSFIQMLDLVGPSLDTMARAAETFGFTMGDSLQNLLGLRDVINNNRELADGIDGLNQLMKSLHNLGAINAATFADLGQTAVDMRDRLVAAGVSGDDALQLMQPTLQTLWELQQRFHFKTDEATQALLDEAEAAGTVGKEHMSAQERMVAGIDKLIGRFDLMLKAWGVDIPADAADAQGAMTDAFTDTQGPAEDLNSELETTARRFREARDAAREFGQEGYDATHAVSYGHSPGGLIDIQSRLEDLKKQWLEQGTVSRKGLGATKNQVDALNKVLHDLARSNMSDFDRHLDDIEQRRRASIDAFVKEMKGASKALIAIGIAAINQISEQEHSQAVWDERHRRAAEERALVQRWTDALQGARRALEHERETSPLQKQLMAIQDSKNAAIRQFLEDMTWAAQSQIDEGLAALNEVFRLQAERIREEIAAQNASTLEDLRNQVAIMREDDPLKKGILQLAAQEEAEIKNFLASMVDATEAQRQEGLKLIEELYNMKEEELRENIAKQAGNNTSNQLNMESGAGTVSWSMQNPDDGRNPSAEAMAQAIKFALGTSVVVPNQLTIQIPIGREMKSFVIDLQKEANRNGLAPVQSNNVVDRLS